METKLKPFDLEAAKAGTKVVTRDGLPVRIICFDREDDIFHIIGLVSSSHGERVIAFNNNGKYYSDELPHSSDLFMAPVKHEGWVNVYKTDAPCFSATLHSESVFRTKEDAMMAIIDRVNYIDTVKLEWEE